MQNHQLGRTGAITAFCSVLAFALSMLIPDKAVSLPLSYATSLFICLGYVAMACSQAALADAERKACAYAGMAFAAVYACFILLVYFTQLTTVIQKAAPEPLLTHLTYRPGSWMFNVDLLGYAMLSLSATFTGLSITPHTKKDIWLRRLMLVHGAFAAAGLLPMFGLFAANAADGSGDIIGILVLETWCLYFLPIAALFANYMKRLGKKASGVSHKEKTAMERKV